MLVKELVTSFFAVALSDMVSVTVASATPMHVWVSVDRAAESY